MSLKRLLQEHRLSLLLAVSGASIIFYAYANPPLADQPLFQLGLQGDLDWYVSRFFLSFVCFALLPGLTAVAVGYRLSDLGVSSASAAFRSRWYWLAALAFAGISAASAFNPPIAEFYPYSKTLAGLAATQSPTYFLVHALAYLTLYYLPWEFLFRGVLILPLIDAWTGDHPADRSKTSGRVLAIASMQIFPTVLLHYPHPWQETVSSLVFGLVAGYLVVRTRSILPGLVFHAAAGVALDLVLVLRGL